jgi:hypothetical protein
MSILFTSKFRHSSSIAKTTIFMNNKVDSKKTFEELLKYLSHRIRMSEKEYDTNILGEEYWYEYWY